ncbi:MAG: hypothetical protein LBH34_05455 [Prevotellaceae bacterium]|jgi:hypothetical protein|nr:hypothetical protein [Prevotellaceae bacterium]
MSKIIPIHRIICPVLLYIVVGVGYSYAQGLKIDGATFIAQDKLGFTYVVTGDRVAKYDRQLIEVAKYTSSFGRIESVDASDPFKILLFCKDFLRVVLLDNKLATLGNPIFLPDVNSLMPGMVCRSGENGMWIADMYKQQLLYVDFTLNTTREMAMLNTHIPQEAPVYGVERNGKLFINYSNNSIAVFDKFGSLLQLLTIKAEKWFEVLDNKIYYLSSGQLYVQDMLPFGEPTSVAENVEVCAIIGKEQGIIYGKKSLRKIPLK